MSVVVRRRHQWQDFVLSCFEKNGAIIRERNPKLPKKLTRMMNINECIEQMREELYAPSELQKQIMCCRSISEITKVVKRFDEIDQQIVLLRRNSVYRDYIGLAEEPKRYQGIIHRSKSPKIPVTHRDWLYEFINNIADINSEFARDVMNTTNLTDLQEVLLAHPW